MRFVTPFFLLPLAAGAQSLVSTAPLNRTVLLEDFTGIYCQYCPDGHQVAAGIKAADPDRVVLVNVHAGPYATPGAGDPDFRTNWGDELNAYYGPAGYPAGLVNRRVFNAQLAMGRGSWAGASQVVMGLPSPVNIGLATSFDPVTRELEVDVELYYTDNSPGGTDRVIVLLKESGILGPQSSTSGFIPSYTHNEVLRAYLTPTWGDEILTTTAGSSVANTYIYTVPAGFDIANCEVVAFIGEHQGEIYQAREVVADGGTTLVIGTLADDTPLFAAANAGAGTSLPSTFTNALGADADYLITLISNDAPADWNAQFTVDGTIFTGSGTVGLQAGAAAVIDVSITPGPTPAVATYLLTIASVTEPGAPVLTRRFHLISGVTDLVITNPQAEPHESIYTNALVSVNQTGRASATRALFNGFGAAAALGGVLNIYYNVSWTFPGLTDEVVGHLSAFMDAGGNLMIAGQDIGWDNSGATGSYGTPVTQAFYTNYLHATYLADGGTANSSVAFEDADAVFGTVPNSAINTVFGSNSYPEEIEPIPPAVAIMRYNNPSKIGAVRAQTSSYKVVYFGVGPEQMTSTDVARLMVALSHDWFYGLVSVEEFDAAFGDVRLWPVPANNVLRIASGEEVYQVQVFDAAGRMRYHHVPASPSRLVELDVRALSSGAYAVRCMGRDGLGTTRTIMVVH